MKKVMVALSGGVDSSVCAKLLKDKGYNIIGGTMELFDKNNSVFNNNSTNNSDYKDAKSIADKLNIDFYAFNCNEDFKKYVILPFIESYENGGTPNPCLNCNKYLKFDLLIKKALLLNCDYIATGHYAQIEYKNSRYKLKKAKDLKKDQSYVLYSLTQEQLSHTLFPLGNLTKEEVKQIANDNEFITANKKESQDICFVPDGDYVSFIKRYTNKDYPIGNFIDKNSNILGKHKGIINYTIGQRKGLGIALNKPMYVCDKNSISNTVLLGDNIDLFAKNVIIEKFNWLRIEKPNKQINAYAKIRYNMQEQPCTVYAIDDYNVKIIFDEPQRAVTKGQGAVLYDAQGYVLGGGIIK